MIKKAHRIYHRQWFNLTIEIHLKNIKSLRLKVRGKTEPVRVSAPDFVAESVVYDFVERNLNWIAHKQAQLAERLSHQVRFEEGETHYLWGEPKYLIFENNCNKNQIVNKEQQFILQSKDTVSSAFCQQRIEALYRREIQAQLPSLLAKWQPIIGRSVSECRIKNMRTRWGTCNIQARRIWLSLALAQKPLACLEYVFVHEMVHLHERNHTPRFYRLMAEFLPDWKEKDQLLNNRTSHHLTL